MPKFEYVVKDGNGKTFRDTTDAYNQKALVDKLQTQGLYIIRVKELQSAAFAKKKNKGNQLKFHHNRVKLDDLLAFSRQLATMLESGVPLIRCLNVTQEQTQSKKFYYLIAQVKHDIEQGKSLSVSLAKNPKVFNPFWSSLVEVGEASGTLPMVLTKLTFYLEQQAAFRSTIISGTIYPCILFVVSMGAVFFFALVVGPKFEAVFKSMNAPLPWITIQLLALFAFIKTKFLLIFGVLFAIFISFRMFIKTYSGRLLFEQVLFSLPVFGEITRNIILERFASQMAILLETGVPILYALDITERLVDNKTCALIVSDIKDGVKKGQALSEPMRNTDFFPPMMVQMISVGEETGDMGKMFKHVSHFYQEYVETFMKRFATIIEPFMIVFMGAIVGTIVIAMFLPLFNISQIGGAR